MKLVTIREDLAFHNRFIAVQVAVLLICSFCHPACGNDGLPIPVNRDIDFVVDIQPIFRDHCVGCHGEATQESRYRLDNRERAMQGGDVGDAPIIAGHSAASPLIHYVAGLEDSMLMPPDKSEQPRLSTGQIAVLRAWIDQGARWPDSASAQLIDRSDWWSLKPMILPVAELAKSLEAQHGQPKVLATSATETANPIDAFVDARLIQQGLTRSPEADRRTLIRRLYFDLTGLPPLPQDVEQFVVDLEPRAWERLVDRLLESPRYGERWARHWLDVVHYGETHGYDKDRPRNNAWPYRDYVIRALNDDKPYARFVQEQIAGDVLYPHTRDGIEALGFIAAGPWDLISHAELPETKIDGKIARHMDRDDMVQNTMLSFTSLTVGCAQCHDHKFDAISQEDYYCLQAVFAAVDRADVSYYRDDELAKRASQLQQLERAAQDAIAAIESSLKQQAGDELAQLDRRIAEASRKADNANPEYGYHSSISEMQLVTKWVQVDLGQRARIDRVELLPCSDDFNGIGHGFGFPVRFKIEASDDAEFKSNVSVFRMRHLETFMSDFANPGLSPFATSSGNDEFAGRYVRVTATKLAPRQDDFIFAIAELQVFDEYGKNLALGRPVTALDSIEAPPRWGTRNLSDGIAPVSTSTGDRGELVAQREALLLSSADQATRDEFVEHRRQLRQAETALKELPEPSLVYAGAVYSGNGNFQGTGSEGGKPRAIHVLRRGDVNQVGKEVGPGAIAAIEVLPSRFNLPTNHAEGQRRAALAEWLTNDANPLAWRSIVNRVWQHHFGRGLVDTPNDFGRNGALPSHPELLDWLAIQFRDGGGSLKDLHRLMVTSATYRQSSATRAECDEIDSENTYLWRMNRSKLDAESLRDSVLFLSGKLDLKMGGPSFQDFVVEFPEHSPHYEYGQHDPDDLTSHRRSIYRFIVRSQLEPLMTALDCADPSMQVDKRNESLSPIQALALLNNGLMVTMSKHFAAKLDATGGDMASKVDRAFRDALSRAPTSSERTLFTEYAQQHGLANLCRVIFNLNEFVFVD